MKNKTLLFRDRPLFGLDITPLGVHAMQLKHHGKHLKVEGYAEASLDKQSLQEGTIVNPEQVAATIKNMLASAVTGDISASRVAISIPADRTFSRAVNMPTLPPKELHDAIMLETEQYTPMPIDTLYVDYTPLHHAGAVENEYFVVAAPRQLVDSYLETARLADLEVVLVETHVDAARRLFVQTDFGTIPSVVIDFHILSADISIIDNDVVATGTVSLENKAGSTSAGVQTESDKISAAPTTRSALTPVQQQLQLLLREVRRMIRYYQERYDKSHQIEQIVLLGNEAVLPGIASLMTDQLRLPVRSADPWQLFEFNTHASALPTAKRDGYMVAAGLAAAPFKQVLT